MALNISATAIRNPIPPIVLFIALLFAGLTAYFRLPINQLPNIEFPGFVVIVSQAGAAPAEMETQVVQRVESALTAVNGVKMVTSTVTQGSASTFVELQLNADTSQAVNDARDALSRIRSQLPADINEPVIQRQDTASDPIAYYVIEGKGMTEEDLSWFIDNDLSRELLAVSGVSSVRRLGGVDREIRIQLNPLALLSFGITADEVSRQLRASNIDLPGGRAEVAGQAQTIRTLGGAGTVAQLAQQRIILPDGRSLRLEQLGDVFDGASERSSLARFNGQPVLSFMVQRSKGTSEVKVFDAMEARLETIAEKNPRVSFTLINTPTEFVRGLHESSLESLIVGALLAVLVVFLILRDLRATVIAATAIPLATIPTFAFMEPLDFTLNMITLIALGLVAGVLVDDAIVEIENIVRHMRMGKSPYRAAMEAADEIGLAVVATSATIIAVFLPVSFMTGVTGQFFQQFGITVAIAVFISLLVARLITPMLAAHFLRSHGHEEKHGRLRAFYEKTLRWAIVNPWKTVLSGAAIFVFSLIAMTQLPVTFIPRIDNDAIAMKVEFPPGTPLMEADRQLQGLVARVNKKDFPEIESIFTSINGSEGAATDAQINYMLVKRAQRDRSAYDIQGAMRPLIAKTPDVRASFVQFQGGGSGSDISVQFVSDDAALVEKAADQLVAQMKRLPELADVRSSASLKRPEIQIRPRADEAARLGVSSQSLATAVRIATSGDVEQNLAKYNLADRQVPIRVLLRPDARADLETIKSLRVRSSSGESLRLDSVADVSFGIGESTIQRRDRQRMVSVTANVVKGDIGAATRKVFALNAARLDPKASAESGKSAPKAAPNAKNSGPYMPEGVRLVTAGDTEQMAEFFGQFFIAMLWGLLLIYFVLVLLFRDFFQPITILTAFPLSLGGAVVGLIVTNQPFSMFVGIGIIMLIGIVTKNSILLVDFAVESMHKGMSRNDALFEAGSKRARPIVMTTMAMSAGMIPAAAGWAVDGSLRQGMGSAVIGGLLLSTLLSLVFVPAMFVLMDRLERLIKPMFGRFSGVTEQDRAEDVASRTPAE